MIFVETVIFSKYVVQYLDDTQYINLQNFLMENPMAGDIIQGSGGLRKLRWTFGNKGKRGGVRIIYYWLKPAEKIYFMTIYAKNEIKDLSAKDLKTLKKMIENGL